LVLYAVTSLKNDINFCMKNFVSIIVSLFIAANISAQPSTHLQVVNDSVRVANGEFVLRNSTKNVNGFLYNTGNGISVFRKGLIKLNDTAYIIGADTLTIKSGQGGSFNGTINASGVVNYIPKFTNTTTAGISNIYDDGSKINLSGTAATAPGLTLPYNVNTGIAQFGYNGISLATTTPVQWNYGSTLQGSKGALNFGANGETVLYQNMYYDGVLRAVSPGTSSQFLMDNGAFHFRSAPSVAAQGQGVAWQENLTIKNDGTVLLGGSNAASAPGITLPTDVYTGAAKVNYNMLTIGSTNTVPWGYGPVLQGNTGSLNFGSNGEIGLYQNMYYDGSALRAVSPGTSSQFLMDNGAFHFRSAPSVTAQGQGVAWHENLTIKNDGTVQIGGSNAASAPGLTLPTDIYTGAAKVNYNILTIGSTSAVPWGYGSVLQGNTASLNFGLNGEIGLYQNMYYDGSALRAVSPGTSSQIVMDNGAFHFRSAPSVTAQGQAVAWHENLTLRNDGTVQIGGGSAAVTINNLGTGAVYSNAGVLTNTNPSDQRLKHLVQPITYGLSQILMLKPVSYYYNTDSLNKLKQFGFIAQDVQKIMPDAVHPISENSKYLGLDKDAIYVSLVNAIKELKTEFEDYKKENAQLIKELQEKIKKLEQK